MESRDDEALEFATVQQAEPLYRNPQRLLANMQSQKQANHVQALLEINRKAATLREPEELEQALLDVALQLTPAESAAVLLYEQLDAPATSVTGQNRASTGIKSTDIKSTDIKNPVQPDGGAPCSQRTGCRSGAQHRRGRSS